MYLNGIREAKQKTKTKQNVQDPLWHHQCLFEVNRENPKLLGHTFLFSVMHRDRMRGTQLIGQVTSFDSHHIREPWGVLYRKDNVNIYQNL